MNLSIKELNVLGQITQKGWGVSSMPNTINCSMQNDTITLKYITVVHFAADSALRDQVDRISHESIELLTKCVVDIKRQFKEITGKTIRLKEASNDDSLEVISATNLSPRRISYYRRQVTLKVV